MYNIGIVKYMYDIVMLYALYTIQFPSEVAEWIISNKLRNY